MAENHEALANRFHMELFSKGDLTAADEILTSDFVNHGAGLPPELSQGPEGAKRYAQAIRTGFGDEVNISHDDIIVSGDRIVIRWTAAGHTQGRFARRAGDGQTDQDHRNRHLPRARRQAC